jgi:RNA-directed DNA polymerase
MFQALDQRLGYADVPIKRHVQVAGTKSPFDGNWVYWSKRLQHYPLLTFRQAKLLKKQEGKCRWCRLYFKQGDMIEIDHKSHVVMAAGMNTAIFNCFMFIAMMKRPQSMELSIQLVQIVSMSTITLSRSRVRSKVSRTVLKTRRSGDRMS